MTDKALFLDRDGTLIVKHDYLADPAQVELMPGVREALHHFMARGYRLFLFTNQSGVGRGMFTLDAVKRCNERMLELLDLPYPGFTELCIATEAPDMPTVYRKPSPRFILEMIEKYSLAPAESWMVGDMPCDMQAGLNAKVNAAWIRQGNVSLVPDGVTLFRNFRAFAARCLDEQPDFAPALALDPAGVPVAFT
jgi:D-glycero-D-manno-heptose 1,7-bisphosphate phosphatase